MNFDKSVKTCFWKSYPQIDYSNFRSDFHLVGM